MFSLYASFEGAIAKSGANLMMANMQVWVHQTIVSFIKCFKEGWNNGFDSALRKPMIKRLLAHRMLELILKIGQSSFLPS